MVVPSVVLIDANSVVETWVRRTRLGSNYYVLSNRIEIFFYNYQRFDDKQQTSSTSFALQARKTAVTLTMICGLLNGGGQASDRCR